MCVCVCVLINFFARTMHAEKDAANLQAGKDENLLSLNPLNYEEGR